MKYSMPSLAALGILILSATTFQLQAWDPLPIAEDQKLFMPGSQHGSAQLDPVQNCTVCHGGYDPESEPVHNWYGSMMGQALRDPLFLAALTVANQDSIWALGNPNAGDLCIRCHTPRGWLGGRSEPTNLTAMQPADFDGVSCDSCHRMVDPFNGLRQLPGLPGETEDAAVAEAVRTYDRDDAVLRELSLFRGDSFYDPESRLPVHFGTGELPDYIEATGGQYVVDPQNSKRGPRFDTAPFHSWNYSRYHRTGSFCAACHDVSNPVLANVVLEEGLPERQATGSYFHVERTWSEFSLSAYGQPEGAATNPTLAAAGVPTANSCQDCHMPRVEGRAWSNPDSEVRPDRVKHDLTGGNAWLSGILATLDQKGPVPDPVNFALLSGQKYPGAQINTDDLQNRGQALLDGRDRALAQLRMAADLILVDDSDAFLTLRIQNNTGHKLISGFPEGRRMWLNLQFLDARGAILGEINPYEPLVVESTGGDVEQYVSGGDLQATHGELVYEAQLMSSLTGEDKTFHIVLATDRYKDNRIPPRGFTITAAPQRLVQPRWEGQDAPDLYTSAEYAGGYDEVVIAKPEGTVAWQACLYYQTTSRSYIEFLRDQIDGSASTLTSPTPSGEIRAYIAQDDPFFSSLKDWGSAIWELWLHNGGSAPVLMTRAMEAQILGPVSLDDGNIQVRFPTLPGRTYQLEHSPILPADTWMAVGDPVSGDGNDHTVTDQGPGPESSQYYRLAVSAP